MGVFLEENSGRRRIKMKIRIRKRIKSKIRIRRRTHFDEWLLLVGDRL